MATNTSQSCGRVRLEPELESLAGTFGAAQSEELARLYERWARQLRVKAKILRADAARVRRPSLKRLAAPKLVLN